MKYFIIIVIILFSGLTSVFSQEVKNIRISQNGNRVNVLFDLAETSKTYKVDLYVTTDDGITWTGPLKSVSGDVGNNVPFGSNRQIIWDIVSEKGLDEGYMQFKVVAESLNIEQASTGKTNDTNAEFKKYKTGKTISLTLALASAGTGIFAYIQGNKLYDEYKTATDNAADLHSKIQTYDLIYPIAFALAGASTVTFAIYAGKQNKLKKQLSFQPIPIRNGGGLLLTYKF